MPPVLIRRIVELTHVSDYGVHLGCRIAPRQHLSKLKAIILLSYTEEYQRNQHVVSRWRLYHVTKQPTENSKAEI